jgi:hypothetical protein
MAWKIQRPRLTVRPRTRCQRHRVAGLELLFQVIIKMVTAGFQFDGLPGLIGNSPAGHMHDRAVHLHLVDFDDAGHRERAPVNNVLCGQAHESARSTLVITVARTHGRSAVTHKPH